MGMTRLNVGKCWNSSSLKVTASRIFPGLTSGCNRCLPGLVVHVRIAGVLRHLHYWVVLSGAGKESGKRCQKYKSIGSWVLMMSVYTGSMHDMYFFIYIHYTHLLYMHVLLICMYTYVYHIYIHISYIFNLTVCLLTLSIEHCPRSFQTQAGINSEGQSRFGPSSVPWLWWRRL